MSGTRNIGGPVLEIEVSIIVVTHGAREMTLACLRSLAETTGLRHEVIVVDNASPGALSDEIAALHPDFHVLSQATNTGFAAAANLGADVARGEHLLFLNPDTVVSGKTLGRLVEFARSNPHAGPIGVRTCFADGTANPVCCRRKSTLWRLLCTGLGLDTRVPELGMLSGMGYAKLPATGAFEADIVCGVCLLVERSVWDRLAGFSPAFFMYGEDEDFSLRATRSGRPPMLAVDLTIVHHGSGTEPNQARKVSQLLAARALIVRGYFSGPVRPLGRLLLALRPLLGSRLARRELRPLWREVWAQRRQWLFGRFA